MPRTPGRFPRRTFNQPTPTPAYVTPPAPPPTVDRVCVTSTSNAPTTVTVAIA